MSKETQTFRHRRTAEGAARFLRLWPESGNQGTEEEFNGIANRIHGVIVVSLFDGEKVVVLTDNGDQSGAETAVRLVLNVDDAEIPVTSCGGRRSLKRLAGYALPKEAMKVIADWISE